MPEEPAPADPTVLVRVTDKLTGHQYTTRQLVVDAQPSRYRALKQPATDRRGRPLPPTFKTPAPDEAGEADVTTAATTDTNTEQE